MSTKSWNILRGVCNRPIGEMSLHELLVVHAPSFAIMSRLQSVPSEAARELPTPGRFPLHLAIEEGLDDAVVLGLLALFPEAASAIDPEDHSTALHLAASHLSSARVIKALIAANSAAASMTDEDGALPIHLAAEASMPIDAVLPIHHAFPAGAAVADAHGSLPLHVAVKHGAPQAVVATLLLAHRDGTKCVDANGNRPVDYALMPQSASLPGVRAALVAATVELSAREALPTPSVESPRSPGSRWRRLLGSRRSSSTMRATWCCGSSLFDTPTGVAMSPAPAVAVCS